MAATAQIKINNSKNSGGVKGSNNDSTQDKILDELKKMNKGQEKTNSGMASLLNLGKLGGLLGLATLGANYGVPIGANILDGKNMPRMPEDADGNPDMSSMYAKVNIEGLGERIARVDEKTGKIEELMTIEEAEQRNILNNKGEISKRLQAHGDKWQEATSHLEMSNGYLMISLETLSQITAGEARQKQLQDAINKAMEEKLRRMQYGQVPGAQDFSSSIWQAITESLGANGYNAGMGIGTNNGQGYSANQQIINTEAQIQQSQQINNMIQTGYSFTNNQWSSTQMSRQ